MSRLTRFLTAVWPHTAAILLVAIAAVLPARGESRAPADLSEAMAIFDDRGATGPEGIWQYPDDGITVAILRDTHRRSRYNISVVESDDVRLSPGDILGYMTESPDPAVFRLSLFSDVAHGALARLTDCLARYRSGDDAIIVEAPEVRLRVTPSMVLPVFWSKLRLGTGVKVSDPARKIPEGMIRIYPSYDGNGSSKHNPRYL